MVLHACPHCPYTSVSTSTLQIHVRWHTGERPFQCGACNASFATEDHLHRHVRLHTDERPYACDYCDATFRDRTAQRRHLATHLDVKPFSCGCCGYCFARRDACHRHEAKCGRKRVKVKEERVLSFLESTGLEFQREATVWFGRAQRHCARVDFVVPFEDRLVYVEVDEFQHVDYGQRKDLERTWHLFETCLKPLHLIRLNPDQFTVNGRRHNILCSQRMELLLEAIKANVWGGSYICYDKARKFIAQLAITLILALAIRSSVGPARLRRGRRRVPRTWENAFPARSAPA